ncbi:uncharacterized protein Dana_GF11144, isoform D [Drosophila ananassae]|uniref:Uncharacterized protein, isoform D n=1 Tax=Drosophila ananassae TaxID=7217 RepID=A0A0P8Y713_DROAN|nr:uncharacterized protein LOC6494009 isoform X13 [Drosophila ananassae]KPU77184.1 uncharacterized protein Dana_GF11144, isoform D [Drosophila ananassae]
MEFVEYYYFTSFFLIFLILIRAYVCPNHKWKCICCLSYSQESADRQGNVFTVPEERSHNRYGDIFFIEPGSEEANRIREQLEKDEKELPSYDEVMRMCNLTTPTSAAAPLPQSALPEPLGPIGIPALPAPPYSETDPHLDASGATVIAMEPVQPSTSRAAQILPTAAPPATPSPATQTTV